jgi:hypothetical protein
MAHGDDCDLLNDRTFVSLVRTSLSSVIAIFVEQASSIDDLCDEIFRSWVAADLY